MEELKTNNLFLQKGTSIAYEFLLGFEYPWQALVHIKDFILKMGKELPSKEYEEVKTGVWVSKEAKIFKSAYIEPPCIIGRGAEVRHCAFIRGSAVVGDGAVVGNSTELKNCILFDGVQVPHYNYVGDSILGYKSHLGAGSITSNVKSDKTLIKIMGKIDTGLKKIGAIIGDFCEIGCGTVLNPGTVLAPGVSVYPLSFVRGYVAKNHIYKGKGEVVKRV